MQWPKPGGTGDPWAGPWFAPRSLEAIAVVRKGGAHGAKAQGLRWVTSASGLTFLRALFALTCEYSGFLENLGITSGISTHGLGQGSLLLLVQEKGARTQMPKDAQGVRGPSPDL